VKDVIKEVMAQGYKVLGFEGFELEGAHIHPRLDLIYDAARRRDVSDPTEVLSKWPTDVWVDVVLARV
jgi:hypothetical protein